MIPLDKEIAQENKLRDLHNYLWEKGETSYTTSLFYAKDISVFLDFCEENGWPFPPTFTNISNFVMSYTYQKMKVSSQNRLIAALRFYYKILFKEGVIPEPLVIDNKGIVTVTIPEKYFDDNDFLRIITHPLQSEKDKFDGMRNTMVFYFLHYTDVNIDFVTNATWDVINEDTLGTFFDFGDSVKIRLTDKFQDLFSSYNTALSEKYPDTEYLFPYEGRKSKGKVEGVPTVYLRYVLDKYSKELRLSRPMKLSDIKKGMIVE